MPFLRQIFALIAVVPFVGCQEPPPKVSKGGGSIELKGAIKRGHWRSVFISTTLHDNAPVDIGWPVSKEEYVQIKEGMSPEDIRSILQFEVLKYTPRTAESELILICKNEPAFVTLIFSGLPNVKLTHKSAEGLE